MSAPAVGDAGIDSPPADLTWLLHRAAQRMRTALDQVAQASGLAGVRDWIVLAALTASQAGPSSRWLTTSDWTRPR